MATVYDLKGPDGIQVFIDLPEGAKVTLTDGSVAHIIGNPRDGGFIMVEWDEHPDPSLIGKEDMVFFNQVVSAESE